MLIHAAAPGLQPLREFVRREKTMLQRFVVIAAAWLEIIVGASLVGVPDVLCVLLFATKPEGIGVPLARFAGVGLLSLGIACLPSTATASRRGVVGLFVFNVGLTMLFVWVGVGTTFQGFLLWPVVILHAALATALVPQLLTTKG
jgi:hypothetical protein